MLPLPKTAARFNDLVMTLALQGYTQAHEVDEAELAPVARAWLIETTDLDHRDDRKTRILKLIWTRSVCAEVMEWSEFHQACNTLLAEFARMEPYDMSMVLLERLLKKRGQKRKGPTVVPISRYIEHWPVRGGPAA